MSQEEKYASELELEDFLDRYSDYMNDRELKEVEEILRKEFIII